MLNNSVKPISLIKGQELMLKSCFYGMKLLKFINRLKFNLGSTTPKKVV